MEKNIALIRGDGIGPEIVEQAVLILNRVAEIYGHSFRYTDVDMAATPLISGVSRCPRLSCKSAWIPTACFWARWAARSGTMFPAPCGRKRGY